MRLLVILLGAGAIAVGPDAQQAVQDWQLQYVASARCHYAALAALDTGTDVGPAWDRAEQLCAAR